MKILVTNDDGIDSAGIDALKKSLSEIAEVVIVAPHKEQSAVGHGITMQIPLRVFEYYKNGEFFGYAVMGTPVHGTTVRSPVGLMTSASGQQLPENALGRRLGDHGTTRSLSAARVRSGQPVAIPGMTRPA